MKKDKMEPKKALIWRVLSFFSLEPEMQASRIGPAEEWFCREDKGRNPGANYLMGMAIVFSEYKGSWFDFVDGEQQEILEQIEAVLGEMNWQEGSLEKIWTLEGLSTHGSWGRIRDLSRQLLSGVGVRPCQTKDPLWFPDLIHVEHYSPELAEEQKKIAEYIGSVPKGILELPFEALSGKLGLQARMEREIEDWLKEEFGEFPKQSARLRAAIHDWMSASHKKETDALASSARAIKEEMEKMGDSNNQMYEELMRQLTKLSGAAGIGWGPGSRMPF